MTPRSLATLVAIDRLGSFAKAAGARGLTLSAVSMQMKALEEELGQALFDRRVRPPRLTPIGRRIAEEARGLLAAEDRLRRVADTGSALAGDFEIGFVLTASVRVLPGFLARAGSAAPEARFRVGTGLSEDLTARVLSGQLDAAVVTRVGPGDPDLGVTRIATEEIAFAYPPGHAADLAEAMAALPFLQFMPETGIGRLIAERLADDGLRPRRQIVLDGIEATVACVRQGIGFSALPVPDLERYGAGEIAIRPLVPPLTRELALVTRAGGAADARRADLALLMTGEDPAENGEIAPP